MKDLIVTSADGSISHTFKTDLLANDGSNFTILVVDPQKPSGTTPPQDSISLFGTIFHRTPYSLATFKAFCVTNDLKCTIQDSNGNNAATLVPWQSPAGTHYPIVSANGGTKTFLVATDVSASFAPGNHLVVYNSDYSIFGRFTEASDAYGAPNTSIVVNEVLTDIGAASGKFIVNLG